MSTTTLYVLSVLINGPTAIDQMEVYDMGSCEFRGREIVQQMRSEGRYKAVSYKCIEGLVSQGIA